MRRATTGRIALTVLGLAAAVLVCFGAGRILGMATPQMGAAPAIADSAPLPPWAGPWAEAVKLTVAGQESAQVKIGGMEVFGLHTTAGGLGPFERCKIAAQRINDALHNGSQPGGFVAGTLNKLAVVQVGSQPIITVDLATAQLLGKPGGEVAAQWAAAIQSALTAPSPTVPAGTPSAAPTTTDQGASAQTGQTGNEQLATDPATPTTEWVPPEPYEDKYVPILSLLEGVKLGVARVNGPRSEVAKVQAVAQIETHFESIIEIDIYIPISTKVPGTNLTRVQGVGVTGLADLKLQEVAPTMKRPYVMVVAALLICAFTLGLFTAPHPAYALGVDSLIKAGLMLWGVGWVVNHYGSKMNDFVNKALGEHNAAIKGETKVVPIFRLGVKGIGGTAVGACQIMGPAEQVKKVTFVGELEPIGGGTLRVRGLIPLSTKQGVTSSVKGIGGVGVSADIKFPI